MKLVGIRQNKSFEDPVARSTRARAIKSVILYLFAPLLKERASRKEMCILSDFFALTKKQLRCLCCTQMRRREDLEKCPEGEGQKQVVPTANRW